MHQRIDFLLSAVRFKKAYHEFLSPLCRQHGLSQIEADILLFLENNAAFNTARDICALRGLAKSNVSTAVDSLRQRGLLTVRQDPECRRLNRLLLTEDGHRIAGRLCEFQSRFFLILLDGIPAEMQKTAQDFFGLLDQNIARMANANYF